MHTQANTARDPFRFSLGGVAFVNTHAFVPAIADDALNSRLARRMRAPSRAPGDIILAVENVLARYFAPGRCEA